MGEFRDGVFVSVFGRNEFSIGGGERVLGYGPLLSSSWTLDLAGELKEFISERLLCSPCLVVQKRVILRCVGWW